MLIKIYIFFCLLAYDISNLGDFPIRKRIQECNFVKKKKRIFTKVWLDHIDDKNLGNMQHLIF